MSRYFSPSAHRGCSARSVTTSPTCNSSFQAPPARRRPVRWDSARFFPTSISPDGSGPGGKRGNRGASTLIQYFDVYGELLFSSFAPATPGNGGFSFLGAIFADAHIARVRIISGDLTPGPDDDASRDIVMTDDFIYGEPRQ